MSSGDRVKTTVRLPADLHWKFQKERAVRRLSNEMAIQEAFSIWIAESKELTPKDSDEQSRFGNHAGVRSSGQERQCVERLLRILRNTNDPARALAVRSVIQALSGISGEEHANPTGFAIPAKSADDFEKRVEQLHQETKVARRRRQKDVGSNKGYGNGGAIGKSGKMS